MNEKYLETRLAQARLLMAEALASGTLNDCIGVKTKNWIDREENINYLERDNEQDE